MAGRPVALLRFAVVECRERFPQNPAAKTALPAGKPDDWSDLGDVVETPTKTD